MAASSVGNIHVNLLVNTGSARNFTSAANVIGRDSQRMRQALGGTHTSVTALRATMSQGWRSRIFGDMIRQASQTNNEVAKLRASMMALSAITGTSVTGAFAATFLLQTADQANRLNNQLRTVSDTEENLIAVRQRLFAISQTSRSDMAATVTLYSRLSRAAQEFGTSQEDVVRVTETIQKSFAIGGASQAEASGAAIQLSQGIASDRFSGEEYRSVSENAPVLLQQMAKHLGVTIGKLREMAHAGELTGKVVTEAILGASKAIDEDFNKTIVTVGQGLTRVGNAFLMYVGETDSSLGATRRLSEALSALAENFDEIAPWITGAAFAGATIFGGRMAGKAAGGVVDQLAAQTKASRDNAAAIMSGNAVALNSAKANELRTRALRDGAQAELAAASAKVATGQADAVALRQTLTLAQAQRARAVATTELNRGIMEATGRTGTYTTALTAQNSASKTVLATQNALRATEVALTANKAALASQTATATAAAAAHNAALAATTVRARAAAGSMNAMRVAGAAAQRVGGGLLGLMGGWTGIAFTAAIAGAAIYATNAAKAEERTNKLRKEMHTLGLISDEVAGVVEDTAESLENLSASAIKVKLAEIADEIERMKSAQNIFDQMFSYDPDSLGNILQQLERVRAGFTPDGKGASTLTPDQLYSTQMLEGIVQRAKEGDVAVEVLLAQLDAVEKNSPGAPLWLSQMIESLRTAIPLMEGLQTLQEQQAANLEALNAAGISTGWVEELIAQQEAMDAAKEGADAVRAYTDEQVRALGLSEDEAALEKIKLGIRKELKDAIEDGLVVQEYSLDLAAREILAAEKAKEAREAAAKAQEDFNEKVTDLSSEIDAATSKFEDMQAAATIKQLLEDFGTGTMSAETLKTRLEEVNTVNLSDPMDKLIEKIIAAIGPLAQLLGIFNSFGGGASPLGGDLPGPARPGGALGRSRRELEARQAVGQGVLDSAVAEAGLSERDAWIKDKTADLEKQATALGGVATNASATAATLWEMDQAQKAAGKSGKDAAKDAEKYAEAMAELEREVASAPLDPFIKEVLAAAEGMGIATDELDAFVLAVGSGGLDAAPEKFRKIAAAMQEIKAVNVLQDLRFEQDQMFRSDVERNVAETLRTAGLTESDPYGEMIASQIRFNEALSTGKEIASEFFGGFISDLQNGASFTEALGDAVGKLQERLIQMALDQAIQALFGNLMGIFGGGNFIGGTPGAPPLKLGFQTGIPGYASGTDFHPGGLARIFEKGGEILDLPRGTRVIPHDVSVKALAEASGKGGGGTLVQVHNYSGAPVKEERTRGADGLDVTKIIIGTVNSAMADGRFDSILGATFGIKRKGV